MEYEPGSLFSKGGPINLHSRGLIQSCYRRYGWVKRRATSSRSSRSANEIDAAKTAFVADCNELIQEHSIRNELIINFDEISAEVLPAVNYSMHVRGAGNVTIAGIMHHDLL